MHHLKIRIGHRMYHLMDTPGIKSLVANTIIGIAQADAALLVLDGLDEETFNAGLEEGQTKEHVLIA